MPAPTTTEKPFLLESHLSDNPIDKKDRRLLQLLQGDCTVPLQQLADAVALTPNPCWKRIRRLEQEGYIRARVALLDPARLGLTLSAVVQLKTTRHSEKWYRDLAQVVALMPEVQSLLRTTGEYDYLLRVWVPDMNAFDALYKRLVGSLDGIEKVTTSFVMEQIRDGTQLPL